MESTLLAHLCGGPTGYLICKFSQCCFPLFVVARFTSTEINSKRTIISCAGFLRSTVKDVFLPSDLKIHKTGLYNRGFKLCFQQSTCNSSCPEIYVAFSALWHSFLHQYIGDLKATSGLEYTSHLS